MPRNLRQRRGKFRAAPKHQSKPLIRIGFSKRAPDVGSHRSCRGPNSIRQKLPTRQEAAGFARKGGALLREVAVSITRLGAALPEHPPAPHAHNRDNAMA